MKSFEKGQTKHRKVMPILHTYQINISLKGLFALESLSAYTYTLSSMKEMGDIRMRSFF